MDGGVFDVPARSGEVVIPIEAKIPVGEAVLFTVAVEKPGGGGVSDPERIAFVAPPAASG